MNCPKCEGRGWVKVRLVMAGGREVFESGYCACEAGRREQKRDEAFEAALNNGEVDDEDSGSL